MAVIAPWLKAADTLGAINSGVRAGSEMRSENLAEKSEADQNQNEHANIAQRQQQISQAAQQAAQQFGLEQQRLEAAQKQSAVQNQLSREQLERNYQLQLAREAVTASHQQQQIDIQKQRVQQEGAKQAKHLSDLSQFNQGLAAGMNPKDLAMKFPDAYAPGQIGDILREPAPGSAKMSDADKAKLASMYKLHDEAINKSKKVGPDGTVIGSPEMGRDANYYQTQIDKIESKYNQPAPPTGMDAAMTQQPAPAATPTPAPGAATEPGTQIPPGTGVIGTPQDNKFQPNPQKSFSQGTVPAPAPADNSQYPTATNPKTGAKVIFKDGTWQPAT